MSSDVARISLLSLELFQHFIVLRLPFRLGSGPAGEAQGFRAAHPDLYAAANGRVRLAITRGMIPLASINAAKGLGSAVHPGFAAMERME